MTLETYLKSQLYNDFVYSKCSSEMMFENGYQSRMSTKDIRMYTTAALENVYRGHSEVYHGSSRECPRLPCRHSQCSIANVHQGHGYVHQGTSRECPAKTFECVPRQLRKISMGWQRLVGSLKLEVSFAEYRLFYRALLQKRPMILRSLRIVATPYEGRLSQCIVHVHQLRMSTKGIRMYPEAACEKIYGVATMSRRLKIIGLFCKRAQ